MIVGVNFCLEVFVVSTICDVGLLWSFWRGLSGFIFWRDFYVGIQHMWTILGNKNSYQRDNFGPQTHRHTDTLLIFIPIDEPPCQE